jgi:predicted GIY-YIG superfamily endonuclease
MPKHNINYENCIIYKISCKDENCKDIYIGQTCDLIRRKYAHKTQSQNKNMYLYTVINENGGWENWKMEVVEKYLAKSKQDILDREQYWINTLQANLNTHIRYDPSDYKREWYFKNRERIQQHQKAKRDKVIYDKQQYVIDPENPPDWYLANVKSQTL